GLELDAPRGEARQQLRAILVVLRGRLVEPLDVRDLRDEELLDLRLETRGALVALCRLGDVGRVDRLEVGDLLLRLDPLRRGAEAHRGFLGEVRLELAARAGGEVLLCLRRDALLRVRLAGEGA